MLAVPAFIHLGGIPIKEAIVMSLWVVTIVSLTAVLYQRSWHLIQPKLLVTFGITGMLGSLAGARIGVNVDDSVQYLLFAGLTLVVAMWMLRKKLVDPEQEVVKPCRCVLVALTGTSIGMLTGILGVGGGFLLVPALLWLGISSLPAAVAHSLILIATNGTVAGLDYMQQIPVNIGLTITLAAIAALGSIGGSVLLKRLPVRSVQSGFSIVLAAVGMSMLLKVMN